MILGNEQADKLVYFATPEEQHALLHNNASSLHQYRKFHTAKLKKSLIIALLVDPYIFNPLHRVLLIMNYGK